MNKKFLLLIFLIFFIIQISQEIHAETKVISLYVNATTKSFSVDNGSYKVNVSIWNEDGIIELNNLDNTTNINNQPYLINIIRNLQCSTVNFENLTRTCLDKVATVDGDKLTACYESKGRMEKTSESIQAENLALKTQAGNLTGCQTNLNEQNNLLTLCTNAKKDVENEKQQVQNNNIWYVLAAVILTVIIYYNFGSGTKKTRGGKTTLEKQGRNPTAEADMPDKLRREINNPKLPDNF